jgi:hypothetical protein
MPAQNISVTAVFKTQPPDTYSITGKITGDTVAGVTVSVDPTHSAVTDADGNFTITGLPNGTYTVTPALDGYTFAPQSVIVTVNGSDTAVTDTFVSTPVNSAPPGNNPPTAADDFYFTAQNQTLNVNAETGVMSNDIDPDGDTLAARIAANPANVVLSPDGSFNYTPPQNFTGTVTFSYKVNDGYADSNTATVTITVLSSGTLPVTAVGDKYDAAQDSTLRISESEGVLANDLNAAGKTVELDENVSHGTLTLDETGAFVYTPAEDYSGTDSFTYKIKDANNEIKGVVIINVAPVEITLGSILKYKSTDIDLKGDKLAKAPKLYGIFSNGKKGSLKKVKTSTPDKFSGVWGKKYTLYNKKALKGGIASYYNSKGPDKPETISIMVKGKTAGKVKVDTIVQKVQLVPPVITGLLDHAGNPVTEVSAGSVITITGKYFGTKAPKVALEVNGKLAKCKVVKTSLTIPDFKGKPGAMNPATGYSEIKVILPVKNVTSGTYPLILDNKIGIAATPDGTLPEITVK